MDQSPETSGLVRCDITGRIVPEDEVVTIQGYRVCAEGKAELLDRLKGGERPPGEIERPTFMRRFGCMLLDFVVFCVAGILAVMVFGFSAFFAPAGARTGGAPFVFLQLLFAGLGAAYYILMHGRYGQTIGKMAGKTKVVNSDGTAIHMSTSALRYVCFAGPNLLATLTLSLAFLVESDELNSLSEMLALAGTACFVVSAILAIADREQQRALHDRLARTRVVILD